MAIATQAELDAKPLNKRGKLYRWYKYYTNENNPVTFLNKAESAKAAKYRTNSRASLASIGTQNFTKLKTRLTSWFDQIGLSDNKLDSKLVSLIDAKETKFFTTPIKKTTTVDGIEILTEDILIKEREVEALETQRRSLDMAYKIKGRYTPTGPAVQLNLQVNVDRLGEALRSEIEHKSRAITDLESDPLD